MSLLLDALKEAEARKREAGATAAQAVPRAATEAPSFEIDGALALAEDVAPAAMDADSAPAAIAHGATRHAPPVAASPANAIDPAAAALLAARASRNAATGKAPGAAPVPAASVDPPAVPSGRAAARQRPAPVGSAGAAPVPAASPRLAAGAAGGTTVAATRRPMPWLVALCVVLAVLLGGLFLLDTGDGARVAPVPVAPVLPQPAPSDAASPAAAAPLPLPSPAPESAAPVPALARRAPDGVAAGAADPAPASASAAVTAPRVPRAPPAVAPLDPEPVRIAISRETAPLQAAWSALQAGDVARAEPLYRRVLEDEPGQVDAQLALAVIAQARGDDEAARRGYRRVLESVPDHPRAWGGLAELAGEGEAGAVESRLRQLLAAAPSAPLHFALGNLLSRQQRWDDAQVEYFAAASLAPQAPDYAFNVAVALERIGKSAAALSWYGRCLELAAGGRAARFDVAAVRARVAELQAAPP